MEQTLDNYIAKKKKMKPAPRESIPYKAAPVPSPQVQRQRQQQQQRPPQQQYYQQPMPHYQQPSYRSNAESNVMDTLFGNFTDN